MRFRQFKFVEASRDWALPLTEVERSDADITKIKNEYAKLLSQLSDLGERARTNLLGKFSEKHNLQGMYDSQTGYYVYNAKVRIRGEETGEIKPKISASGSMTGANELAALGLIPDIKMDQFKDQVTSADPDSDLQNKTLEILNKQLKATTDTEPTDITVATIKAEKKSETDPNKLTAAEIAAGKKEAGERDAAARGATDSAAAEFGPGKVYRPDDPRISSAWRKANPDWRRRSAAPPPPPPPKPPTPATATAAPGERVTYQTLARDNDLDPNKIGIGQKIKLPGGGEYTVKAGDTLSQIAQDVRLGNIGAPAAAPAVPTAAPGLPITTTGQADQAVDPADIAGIDDAGLDPDWKAKRDAQVDAQRRRPSGIDDAGLDPDWKAKRDALSVKPDAEADAEAPTTTDVDNTGMRNDPGIGDAAAGVMTGLERAAEEEARRLAAEKAAAEKKTPDLGDSSFMVNSYDGIPHGIPGLKYLAGIK